MIPIYVWAIILIVVYALSHLWFIPTRIRNKKVGDSQLSNNISWVATTLFFAVGLIVVLAFA